MSAKTVFVVRHGQSNFNGRGRYHEDTTPLSELGLQQALAVANRLAGHNAQVVVSSELTRAVQTAELIAERCGLPLVKSRYFVERRRPREQKGLFKNSLRAQEIERAMRENWHNLSYRFSDEENFMLLHERAKLALHLLEIRAESRIIAVTHGMFFRMVLADIILAEKLTSRTAESVDRSFKLGNTAISELSFEPKRAQRWQVVSWGDTAHLPMPSVH